MYLSFYDLRERPFNPTPNPRFLYMTEAHREALAQLEYGVREKKGFLVLVGEVGTGKTTLLQTFMRKLDPDTDIAYVFNPALSFEGLLEYVLEDLGIANGGLTQAQRLFALNRFLIDRAKEGRNTVVIIDEAQDLDVETFEKIRLLSNFETATEKILQIVLAGQPELRDKLNLPELRQLKQRIGLRAKIRPLTTEEVREYIRHRLRIARRPVRPFGPADASESELFTDRAIDRIARYTEGIPRSVNLVCDHCLLNGYADQKFRIDIGTVEEVIAYLEGEEAPSRERSAREASLGWKALGSAVAAGVLFAVTMVAVHQSGVLPVVSDRLASYASDLAEFATGVWNGTP